MQVVFSYYNGVDLASDFATAEAALLLEADLSSGDMFHTWAACTAKVLAFLRGMGIMPAAWDLRDMDM